ncbi:MAG: hypothetical protein U0528_04340 [Anaerolineae bacterium]
MRYWSLLLGVITVAASAWTARRLLGDRVALLAAFFVAVNPILWVFSQEIRAYVVIPLAAVLILGFLEQWLKAPAPIGATVSARNFSSGERGNLSLLLLAITELIALYSQNLAVPLVAWLNITVLAILLWRRSLRRIIVWLAVQLLLLLLYLPWLLTQRPTGTTLNSPPTLNLELLWAIWQSHFTGIRALNDADVLLSGLIAVFGVLILVALFARLRRDHSLFVILIISQVILIPVFELAIIWAAHIDFHPRYFIVSVPAMLILAAWAITPRQIAANIRHSSVLLRLAFALLAAMIMIRTLHLVYSSPIYQHDDFRSIALRYSKLSANDVIVIPYGWEPSLDYYSRKMGIKARFVEIPLHSSMSTILQTLMDEVVGADHAELLTWFQLPADVRAAFPCVLKAIGRSSNDNLTVSGIRTERFDALIGIKRYQSQAGKAARGDTWQAIPTGLLLWGDQGICMLTDWQLTTPTPADWHLAAQAHADFNAVLGQADTLMLNDQQQPTSYWTPTIVTQPLFISLQMPVPDALTVTLSLYHDVVPAASKLWLSNYAYNYQKTNIAWQSASAQFGDFAGLAGYFASEDVNPNNGAAVALLWHPLKAAPLGYRVFVHLISPDERVIAQDDSEPLNGLRPTYSWVPDEYIHDLHRLTFNDKNYHGAARYAVGLYDPVTGERVKLADGSDRLVLPIQVSVE